MTAPDAIATTVPEPGGAAPQRVAATRREYNGWVARESIEDYALRFTPRSFRKWSEWRVAQTALGGAASFLILEAVGATLLMQHGFVNAALAILTTGLVILLAGWPISVYAARYGVDMDLLTRGAGFGYIGSTITSLVYASFTFIFFALEAAVMAYALDLAFDIPPQWGYLLCALVVIPLVAHGVTTISRLQVWTQPLWLVLLVVPYVVVLQHDPGVLSRLTHFAGDGQAGNASFSLLGFGAASTVGIALITQMGEQVDYLRFMPEKTAANRKRWWAAVIIGGPGWVIPGVLKMLGGALLAYLALQHMVPADRAVDPNQMYLAAWELVFPQYGLAVAATAIFVLVSQLKINVTNAYAGSLAWSNFFSRLTHAHPGRVVWMVFNIGIALVLMEMNVFGALGHVLGLYANVAIAWMTAVVADLVINKPLGLSPPGIEFKRAHLYDVNPVGVGAMGIASLLSVAAHLGAFGALAQAFSAAIALVAALIASPLIAWATGGRYYIARKVVPIIAVPLSPNHHSDGSYRRLLRCCVCEGEYEGEDMASCPAYQGPICSLCCTLDARCNDQCKPEATLSAQWRAAMRWLLPRRVWPHLDAGLATYLLLMGLLVPLLGALLWGMHTQMRRVLGAINDDAQALLQQAFVSGYLLLVIVGGIVVWWLVLAQRSRTAAQDESNRQTQALQREIESHHRTDRELQQAKQAADTANQAKSRYITAISHEIRTPLNGILGYAQLLEVDDSMPTHRRHAIGVIRRGGEHLLGLIEGSLDLARIEGGKLALRIAPLPWRECLAEIVRLFELQAAARGLAFQFEAVGNLPEMVRADEKRLRQILINVIGNAVKFTAQGSVTLRVTHQREMARFEVIDTGPGMDAAELQRVFEPFERGTAGHGRTGTGIGLTIAHMLTTLMGGEMCATSTPGVGSTFTIRLFLPQLHGAAAAPAVAKPKRVGYADRHRTVLVVDNEDTDRRLLADMLQPLGFVVQQAESGEAALAWLATPNHHADALFVDLAMPGIDGWETLRRLRAAGHTLPAGVISANAFDQRLENDVGITPTDFLVKPVRMGDVLDWLGQRLQLEWITAAPNTAPNTMTTVTAPPAAALLPLREALAIGHLRGVNRELDQLATAGAGFEPWVTEMRGLARQFQFNTIDQRLPKA